MTRLTLAALILALTSASACVVATPFLVRARATGDLTIYAVWLAALAAFALWGGLAVADLWKGDAK